GDLDGARAYVDHPHPVDPEWQQQVETRCGQHLAGASEPEDDPALILLQHAHAGHQQGQPGQRSCPDQDLDHGGKSTTPTSTNRLFSRRVRPPCRPCSTSSIAFTTSRPSFAWAAWWPWSR